MDLKTASIRVHAAGALTTVQDLGRFGFAASGVSASGAADPLSLRVGNRLAGNLAQAAAIEMTLVGGSFAFEAPAIVAITGSDFSPEILDRSNRPRPVARWAALRIDAGETLRLGPTRSGARCYLCVRGGIDVPRVLGSRSTHVLTRLGGHHGRALRARDELAVGTDIAGPARVLCLDPEVLDRILRARVLRTVPGPQIDRFPPETIAAFHATEWEITEEADRLGLRMHGPALARRDDRQLPTEGVCLGAIQVPESGQPILLFVEQQTTGGYPKIAGVAAADLAVVGQLRPRNRVRFLPIALPEARALLRERIELLAAATAPS